MRSIGKQNIELVKSITRKIIKKGRNISFQDIEKAVIIELSGEVWDTWEMADQEIRCIINDEIMKR